ncbi:hypothetical protein [Streptacidiphilus monticola]|uniref:Peptidase inhibitor family I36 protein n=1 Tax=Streptacidiphilus monticola TaxID=2161674 RepID=A0ABW1GDU1_9ACTN
MKRNLARAVIAGTAGAAWLFGMTSSAYAAGPGGVEACPSNTVCLYYNSPAYGWGSFEHWTSGGYSLSDYTFRDYGNGRGYNVTVANNAAGFVNNTGVEWGVYTQGGAVQYLDPYSSGALNGNIANQDAYLHD